MDDTVGPRAELIGPFADTFLANKAKVWENLAEILLTVGGVRFCTCPYSSASVDRATGQRCRIRLASKIPFYLL